MNFKELDNEIKKLIGQELYDECIEKRDNSQEFGLKNAKFIERKGEYVQYHFTRSAVEIIYHYIFTNRDSELYNAYVDNEGYKLTFKL